MSPDRRQHRGAHPDDHRLFEERRIPAIRAAVTDLSWLLSRGYAAPSSIKLVGDRHGLTERQRIALSRAACSDASLEKRNAACQPVAAIRHADVIVDGFNLLITVEAALGGGLLMRCRDACVRDLASVHSSYKAVLETEEALDHIGETLATLAPRSVNWLFDRPVSNSGRIAQRVKETAAARGWPWSADVVFDPDAVISGLDGIAVTSDSVVLDRVARWANLGAHLIRERLPRAWLVDLREPHE